MSRRQRIITAIAALLLAALMLFYLEPPLFWQGLIYGFLWMFGSPPPDNGPAPTWMNWLMFYGFQAAAFFVPLIVAFVWVVAAPTDQSKEAQ